MLTGDHQLQVKPGTEVVLLDVEVDAGGGVEVVLVVSVDGFEVVADIAEPSGGPGKSRLLGESNSRNGSVGVLVLVILVVLLFGLEVVVVVFSLDLFAIHCNQLRASFFVFSFSVIILIFLFTTICSV